MTTTKSSNPPPPLANSEDSGTTTEISGSNYNNHTTSPLDDTSKIILTETPFLGSAASSSTRDEEARNRSTTGASAGGRRTHARSYSDRRSPKAPPATTTSNNTTKDNNRYYHSSATPEIRRGRTSGGSKRSLYASFKFIDDYSPLATNAAKSSNTTTTSTLDEPQPPSSKWKSDEATRISSSTSRTPIRSYSANQKRDANNGSGRSRSGRGRRPAPLRGYNGNNNAVEDACSVVSRKISAGMRVSVDSASPASLDVQCGIGPYRPSCLQRFADKNWMLFWLCWFCAVQGMLVSGLVPSVLSTIERRFNFRAASLGRIVQWYDIGYALSCVPVSYFGGRHSKPLFIGVGLLVMGAGSFIFSLPHIISDTHIYRERTEDIGACSRASSSMIGESLQQRHLRESPAIAEVISTSWAPMANQTVQCDLLRKQQESFFAVILTGTFRFEVLFCFAHLLHGIGATPLLTLGVSYIDENVKPTLSSLYIAIFYTFVIIGPAAGFLMSGAFLRYHTDFLSTERTVDIMEIDESDPEWVGAWWIGFQIASILSLFAVFPILSFPKILPSAIEWQRTRQTRADDKEQRKLSTTQSTGGTPCRIATTTTTGGAGPTSAAVNSDPSTSCSPPPQTVGVFMLEEGGGEPMKQPPLWQRLLHDLKQMPSSVRKLLTNPAYMCITLAASVEGLLIAGLSGFMAKYLERQFNVASSRANMLIGCIMVPVAGLGTLASGYIVKRFRLTCPRTLKFCIGMAVFSLALSPMFLVLCEPAKLSGVQVPYPTDEASDNSTAAGDLYDPSLKSQCNNHCACSEDEFRPVCGTVNGRQTAFFTSCYAGCPDKYHRTKKIYQNCTCVDGNTVTAGWCESKCSALIGFLILFAPMCLCTFSIGVPALSVVLRCVDYNERSFALGIQWILIRCIGTIPAPAIFAWLFDISCLKRRRTGEDACGDLVNGQPAGSANDGSCFIYDNKKLADLFLAFTVIGQTVTLIFLVLASLFYKSHAEDPIVSEAPPLTPAATSVAPAALTYGAYGDEEAKGL